MREDDGAALNGRAQPELCWYVTCISLVMLCSHDGSVVMYEHALCTARRRTRQYRTMVRPRVRGHR